MIHQNDVKWFSTWFEIYTQEFCTGIERVDSAHCLKVRHTKRVVAEMQLLAESLTLDDKDRLVAETVALFHDIGRFEQYARYHTYADRKSEDHARLGIRVLREKGVLGRLGHDVRLLIETVIAYHNHASLASSLDEQTLFLLKMLRDADKIDIFEVVISHHEGGGKCDAVNLGLDDAPDVTEAVVASVMSGAIARVEDMKTRNDMLLLLLGWVFDLNFPHTFTTVKKRNYIDRIAALLPPQERLQDAVRVVQKQLDEKTMSGADCRT